MKTPLTTCFLVVALAMITFGCSSDSGGDEIVAVAESNASAATTSVADYCAALTELGEIQARMESAEAEPSVSETLAVLGQVARLHDTVLAGIPSSASPDVSLYFSASRSFTLGAEDVLRSGDDWSVLSHLSIASIATRDVSLDAVLSSVESTCPELEDPYLWLTGFEAPFGDPALAEAEAEAFEPNLTMWLEDPTSIDLGESTVSFSDTTDVTTEGLSSGLENLGTGDSSTTTTLSPRDRTGVVSGVGLTIEQIAFHRDHEGGTGRDTDDIYLTVDIDFDQGHPFTETDFVMVSPDGTEHAAATGDGVALDRATLTFPIDRDVERITGWKLQVAGESGPIVIDL